MRTDSELLEASRRGEHAAFGALVERYQDLVCAVTYSRTRDQALSEDVAQDTFLAAWRQLDQLREPNRLRSWLCGIARNLASKARRRRARETLDAAASDALVAEDNPFDAVSAAEADRVVEQALARVPETYRDVLVLYYQEQRSAKDVAAALDLSEAAVLQRLARGRQYLADGVTSLVEKSLQRGRRRRDLAAAVVAALPTIPLPSRVEAATHSTGGTMLKLVLAAALLGAAGTTAYVVQDRDPSSARPAGPAHTENVATAAAGAAVATARPVESPAPVALPTPPPSLGTHAGDADGPDDAPIDAATIDRLALHRGPSRGPDLAPVTIVVFTDLLCSFCGKALGSLDQLVEEYPDKLRLVVKQMPVHDKSKLPAEAALAAEAQGKFWELHDLMLAHQDDLSRSALVALAAQAKLDVAKFETALDQRLHAAQVESELAAARELELHGAPSFVINGRRIQGMRPLDDLRAMIDDALADR